MIVCGDVKTIFFGRKEGWQCYNYLFHEFKKWISESLTDSLNVLIVILSVISTLFKNELEFLISSIVNVYI